MVQLVGDWFYLGVGGGGMGGSHAESFSHDAISNTHSHKHTRTRAVNHPVGIIVWGRKTTAGGLLRVALFGLMPTLLSTSYECWFMPLLQRNGADARWRLFATDALWLRCFMSFDPTNIRYNVYSTTLACIENAVRVVVILVYVLFVLPIECNYFVRNVSAQQ